MEINDLFKKLPETPPFYCFLVLFLQKIESERFFIPQGVGAGCRLFKNSDVRDSVLPLW